MRAIVLLIVLAATLPRWGWAQTNPSEAAATITASDFIWRVGVLAHDSLRGRVTPSPHLDIAAAWAAREFAAAGLQALGADGEYVQRYPLHQRRLDTAAASVALAGRAPWRFGREIVRLLGGAEQAVTGRVLVASGSRLDQTPSEVAGALVIVTVPLAGARAMIRPLLQANPAGVLLVADAGGDAWTQALARQGQASLTPGWDRGGDQTPLLGYVDRATAGALLAAHDLSLETLAARRGALAFQDLDAAATLAVSLETLRELTGPNIVATVAGSDPQLRDEYVVFSAHIDHVGAAGDPFARCRPQGDDGICNGADDDASGSAAVLEIAQAVAALRPAPQRSTVFVLVSGEEAGLWGSDYFARHAPVPTEAMVANFNLDMVGRNWTDTIVAIGREHSDLGATVDRVAAAHPELRMTVIDDQWPGERFYFRSDHFNFARRGVPILFFFNGTHDDYHRPSDETALINGDKASRIARLVFYLGLEVANADVRPQWNPTSYREIVETGRP